MYSYSFEIFRLRVETVWIRVRKPLLLKMNLINFVEKLRMPYW